MPSKKVIYECKYCGKQYHDYEECEACEKSHLCDYSDMRYIVYFTDGRTITGCGKVLYNDNLFVIEKETGVRYYLPMEHVKYITTGTKKEGTI